MELGEGCEEVKVEELRPKAKIIIEKIINKIKEEKKVQEDDSDSEEEIITTKEPEEKKDSSILPVHDDVLMHANLIDRLVELRESIKQIPKSFELIK